MKLKFLYFDHLGQESYIEPKPASKGFDYGVRLYESLTLKPGRYYQYTGRNDASGKEIYHGHVLKAKMEYEIGDEPHKETQVITMDGTVKWEGGTFYFESFQQNDESQAELYCMLSDEFVEFSIMGHICNHVVPPSQ